VIDAATADWDWAGPTESGFGWTMRWPRLWPRADLIADPLPQQSFTSVPPGAVVRSDLVNGKDFPQHPVSVPPTAVSVCFCGVRR
jgi:hypothetical protein